MLWDGSLILHCLSFLLKLTALLCWNHSIIAPLLSLCCWVWGGDDTCGPTFHVPFEEETPRPSHWTKSSGETAFFSQWSFSPSSLLHQGRRKNDYWLMFGRRKEAWLAQPLLSSGLRANLLAGSTHSLPFPTSALWDRSHGGCLWLTVHDCDWEYLDLIKSRSIRKIMAGTQPWQLYLGKPASEGGWPTQKCNNEAIFMLCGFLKPWFKTNIFARTW